MCNDFKTYKNTYKVKLLTTNCVNYDSVTKEQNGPSYYWELPAIDIDKKNALIRLTAITFDGMDVLAVGRNNLMYITCNAVLNSTFLSSQSKKVFIKSVLSSLVIETTSGASGERTITVDDSWSLCVNPFGSKFQLSLIKPFDLSNISIIPEENRVLLDLPISYEIEVRLLDNE